MPSPIVRAMSGQQKKGRLTNILIAHYLNRCVESERVRLDLHLIQHIERMIIGVWGTQKRRGLSYSGFILINRVIGWLVNKQQRWFGWWWHDAILTSRIHHHLQVLSDDRGRVRGPGPGRQTRGRIEWQMIFRDHQHTDGHPLCHLKCSWLFFCGLMEKQLVQWME